MREWTPNTLTKIDTNKLDNRSWANGASPEGEALEQLGKDKTLGCEYVET